MDFKLNCTLASLDVISVGIRLILQGSESVVVDGLSGPAITYDETTPQQPTVTADGTTPWQ